MRKLMFLAGVLAVATLLVACDNAADPTNVGSGNCFREYVQYGNGVLYFPCTESDFGTALSLYLKLHPNVSVVTMTGNGTSTWGYDRGYFVVFEVNKGRGETDE